MGQNMISITLKNSIDKKEHLTRHYDLIDQTRLNTPITVIGAGGIGSWTVFALAKMGFSNITVYDHDDVSIENVGNQLYSFNHVGMPKVAALESICEAVGSKVLTRRRKFTPIDGTKTRGIVIFAVDSMEVRKMLFDCMDYDCDIIDGRMGAEKILLYTASGQDQHDIYEKSLYSDKDAEQAPCTAKATSYCALTIAGLIVGQVKSFIQDAPTIKSMSMNASTGDSIRFGH